MRITYIITRTMTEAIRYHSLPRPMDVRTFALVRAMCNAHTDIVLNEYLN